MDRESVVFEAAVDYFGQIHTATYYVEHGIVHAHIAGRIIPNPVADDGAEATVKRLLVGHAIKARRRADIARRWTGEQQSH